MVIFLSVGPVISTRRSIRPGAARRHPPGGVCPDGLGAGQEVQVPPADSSCCRAALAASNSRRRWPSSRCRAATRLSASGVRISSYRLPDGPAISTPLVIARAPYRLATAAAAISAGRPRLTGRLPPASRSAAAPDGSSCDRGPQREPGLAHSSHHCAIRARWQAAGTSGARQELMRCAEIRLRGTISLRLAASGRRIVRILRRHMTYDLLAILRALAGPVEVA